jgi:5'(3')-deoxyribonucleotidase
MITLYLDMDGVLCNFDKAYRAYDPEKTDRKRFRQAVMDYHIFEDLEFMPDAQELLNYVSKLNDLRVEILTSMGTFDVVQGNAAKYQKMKWLDSKNIPYRANFVRSKEEKAKYATPSSILIDDSIGCVKPFNVAGGTGILHTTSRESIEQLSRTIDIISGVHALRRIKL